MAFEHENSAILTESLRLIANAHSIQSEAPINSSIIALASSLRQCDIYPVPNELETSLTTLLQDRLQPVIARQGSEPVKALSMLKM